MHARSKKNLIVSLEMINSEIRVHGTTFMLQLLRLGYAAATIDALLRNCEKGIKNHTCRGYAGQPDGTGELNYDAMQIDVRISEVQKSSIHSTVHLYNL